MFIFRYIKSRFRIIYHFLSLRRRNSFSRKKALKLYNHIIYAKGRQIVNKKLRKKIKLYCKTTFGSSSYWPWLAVYTEIRGEFKYGWIPFDYLLYQIYPSINPSRFTSISGNKTLDYRLFGDYCVEPLIIILNQLFFDSEFNLISKVQATEILKNFNAEVVIKQDGGYSGKEVTFIESSQVELDEYINKGGFVIQPKIDQYEAIGEIYPISSNTLRVVTYMDSSNSVKVITTALRFGSNGSRVDNASMGGRCVYVDQNGGILTDAFVDKGVSTEEKHPNTGKVYKDLIVPSITELHNMCIKAHYKYPYAGIIAWDVIIDKTGKPFFVEWNAREPVIWYHDAIIGPIFNITDINKKMALQI